MSFRTLVVVLGAVISALPASARVEVAILAAPKEASGFGWSVGLSGDTAVSGAA